MALGDKVKRHTVRDNIATSPVKPTTTLALALVAAAQKKEA